MKRLAILPAIVLGISAAAFAADPETKVERVSFEPGKNSARV